MQFLDEKVLKDLSGIIDSLEELMKKTGKNDNALEIEEVIRLTEKQINKTLYCSEIIDATAISMFENTEIDGEDAFSNVCNMIPVWKRSIERRRGRRIDNEFWTIYEYFKYVDRNVIIHNTEMAFDSYPDEYKIQFVTLPQRYTFLKGRMNCEDADYSLIPIYTDMMKQEVDEFLWLYYKLADYRSKKILLRIIKFWFSFDLYDLSDLHENIFCDYYDMDILKSDYNDVVVDCGAYIGDSALDYIRTYGRSSYNKIYCYEIEPETMIKMKENLNGFDNIIFRQKGVGSEHSDYYLKEGITGAGASIAEEGVDKVEVVPLDEDIDESISLIKMDIEGAETDALIGAKRHIINEKPKLLICTYHKPEDLFSIPRLINSIRGDYTFYLRYNGRGIWPCDHVLFAV